MHRNQLDRSCITLAQQEFPPVSLSVFSVGKLSGLQHVAKHISSKVDLGGLLNFKHHCRESEGLKMIDSPFFKRCCFCRFADYRISSILCKVQLKERKGHSQVGEVPASDQIVPEISRYSSCSARLHISYFTWTCFKNSDRNVINFGHYSIQSVQMILQPWRDTLTKWWIGGNCGRLDHKYMIWLELTLCYAELMTFSSLQWPQMIGWINDLIWCHDCNGYISIRMYIWYFYTYILYWKSLTVKFMDLPFSHLSF